MLRPATEAGRELLIDWFHAFAIESLQEEDDRAGQARNVDFG